MGLSNGSFEENSSSGKSSKLEKFRKLLHRGPVASFWQKHLGKDQFCESVTNMNEMIVKEKWTEGMVSEKEMHEYALKYDDLKITEHEVQEFWESFDPNSKNNFAGYRDFTELHSWRLPNPKNSLSTKNQIEEDWAHIMEFSPHRGQRRQRRQLKIANERCPYTVTSTPYRAPSRRIMFPSPKDRHTPSIAARRRDHQRQPGLPNKYHSPLKQERADTYSRPQS